MNERVKICVLPGDGIGPEVTAETVKVLKVLVPKMDFIYGDIGYEYYLKSGNQLPDSTIEKVKSCDAALFGAVTTPPNIPNYSSPILKLRRALDLYVNLRPVVSYPFEGCRENVNMVIVRENTEGMYSGRERVEDGGDTAITERVITRKGSERIIRYAYSLARSQKRSKVTVVHKANVLRETCGLFRKVALEVSKEFPEIIMEELLVDACAMMLIRKPEDFQVLVTTNLFGDILSDEASMLVGGLGLASSGNIGEKYSVFEPVHGSAPKYAGQNKANPFATMLSAKMMLENMGLHEEANLLGNAVTDAIRSGRTTYDLGGDLTTSGAADAVVDIIMQIRKGKGAAS
jgi:isopropylmalate/isohomocitrate dehydrogenase-like protein